MTRREEEIKEASIKFQNSEAEDNINDIADFFRCGAEWADEHPKSKYNISDIDYVKLMLEEILNTAERVTSGNISHNIAAIKLNARLALNTITEL